MKKFKKIYIEITNRCNLACSFCQPSRRPGAFMGLAAFEEILRQTSGHTDYLSLHVLGEVLLHPDLGRFLAVCHRHGLRVNLCTNGILLDRHRSMLIRQPALRQINISLHSFESPGSGAALDAYLGGIFDFIAAAVSASPLFINLRLWDMPPVSVPGTQDMSGLVLRRLEKHFGLPLPIAEDFSTARAVILAPRVFLSLARRFAWPHAPAPEIAQQGSCRGLRDHIAILVDGTVVPCCLDAEGDIPLGNILQTPLAAILAAPRATLIREGFARQRLIEPLCRRCTYRLRFSCPYPPGRSGRGTVIGGEPARSRASGSLPSAPGPFLHGNSDRRV